MHLNSPQAHPRDLIEVNECPKIYRKYVLHLLKYKFAVYLSIWCTDVQKTRWLKGVQKNSTLLMTFTLFNKCPWKLMCRKTPCRISIRYPNSAWSNLSFTGYSYILWWPAKFCINNAITFYWIKFSKENIKKYYIYYI